MLSILHSSIPSLPPATTPTLTSIFARTFLTSSKSQEAAVPARKGRITKGKLEKLGIDESLLPPKMPAKAFFTFRNDFMKSQPTSKPVAEISKEAGKEWLRMSDAERKVYQDRAAKEHAEYRTKYQGWVNSVHPSVIEKINSLRRETGRRMVNNARSDGINKPLTSYNQFIRDFRTKFIEEHGKILLGTYSKFASEAWRNLSEAEREVYNNRYQKEKAEYLAKLDELSLKAPKSVIKKPSSPYKLFKDDFEKKYIKEDGSREAMSPTLAQLANDAWGQLPEAKKNLYKKRYEKEKAAYLAEMDRLI